jgi:putative ABC transport system permease protein
MLKNYFTLALRNFRKHKLFFLINILGLAVGISAALVIFLIVQYEFSFDNFHPRGDRIYRVVSNLNFAGRENKNASVSAPMPEGARAVVSGLEEAAAFYLYSNDIKVTVNKNNGQAPQVFKDRKHVIFTDQHYFSLFHYQWLAGSPEVLKVPNKVVLSEASAREYFSYPDPAQAIGQVITYGDSMNFTVAGIVKDLDQLTDITFTEFISTASIPANNLQNNFAWDAWTNFYGTCQFFVRLKENVSPEQVAQQMTRLEQEHGGKTEGCTVTQVLQPLNDLHFNSDYTNFNQRRAHKPTLYGLLIVATFLLILGCINFINLTTAQATQRAKEIGIRKTMGSRKRQLVAQFLSETLLLTVTATLLSIALTPLIMQLFGDYIPEGLGFGRILQPASVLFIIALIAIVSLLSGFYPSLVLSRFKPVQVLKNQANSNTGQTRNAWLRKTLTVSQFIIAQFFIIGTIMVAKQIHFSLNKDLGYRKEAIININLPWKNWGAKKKGVLLNKLRSIPELQLVSLAGRPPASQNASSSNLLFDDGKKVTEQHIDINLADTTYFKLYGIKLVAGAWLQPSDSVRKEYMVNETFVRQMGFTDPHDIIGKTISTRDKKTAPVVGVFSDFHTKSLHEAIAPLVYTTKSKEFTCLHILLPPRQAGHDTWTQAIAKIEAAWKEINPEAAFDYTFFDESIADFYKTEQSTSRLLTWASGLAVFISCLGLLGLVVFTTHQRAKEIGVRKVLGASVAQIVSLLSKDFILLVLLAFVITVPLAWWATAAWLQDFAYRTTMPWWVFVAGGGIMIVLALLTISTQTIRSALANPVKALRSE